MDRFQYTLFKELAKLLIDEGANVNSKDDFGRTPLHLAAESCQKDIIELLLVKGAEIDEKDEDYGFTPLHYAARFGNKHVVEYLITKGSDINALTQVIILTGHT